MLPNIKTCENGLSNFSENLRIVQLKLVKITRYLSPKSINLVSYFNFKLTAVIYHGNDDQVISGADCCINVSGSLPTRDTDCRVMFRFSVQCKVIELPAFYDVITGPTEFIISIVNWVKIVNMP